MQNNVLDFTDVEFEVTVERVDVCSSIESMRRFGDHLRDKLGTGLVILGSVLNGRATFVVMATSDIAGKHVNAGDVAMALGKLIGGGGGGSPKSAQAGAVDGSRLDEALRKVRTKSTIAIDQVVDLYVHLYSHSELLDEIPEIVLDSLGINPAVVGYAVLD